MNTRFLNEGEVLFKKNKVVLTEGSQVKKEAEFKKELTDISLLQPNKKLFGLTKTRLWFFNVASNKRESKFRYWLKNKVGEPPALYDSLLAMKSRDLMENYLINMGYFYSKVDYQVLIKKRRATLEYIVTTGPLYTFGGVYFPSDTALWANLIRASGPKSVLKPGSAFRVSDLKAERERITDVLRNNGYYYFNKDYVTFDLDSLKRKHQMDVYVRVSNPSDSTKHEQYYINKIIFHTDFSVDQMTRSVKYDTLRIDEYVFISEKLRYKTDMLIDAVHFRKDNLFMKMDYTLTLNQLADLGVFKFINIRFEADTSASMNGRNYLNCLITLTPAKKQEWSTEVQLNNSSSALLGVATGFNYRNKNIFKGAELFEFNILGALETNFVRGISAFSTVNVSSYINLYINKFLAPIRVNNLAKNYRPKTHFSIKYNYLRRIDYYTVNTTSLSYGYDWRQSSTRRHQINVFNFSLIRVKDASEAFLEILARSQTLRSNFTEQFIIGSTYTYLWSNKALNKRYGSFDFRGDVEIAGNLVHGINSLVHLKDNASLPYKIFNIPYAQYFLIAGEIKNYYKLGKHALLASRLYGGLAVPYGNSSGLPYIKQFYSGGPIGIRAWRVRTLGPGSFIFEESSVSENTNFFYDQTGDMKLEGNVELRFDIFKFIKGALFVDAGNIWTLKADTLRPGANFEFDRFAKEIALGAGIGIRFDFNYFILRFDAAIPIRDPGNPDNRWVIQNFDFLDKNWRKENLKFNLAIGYPF
ncbi:MAG: BamA/TamA family outer membrane protein [Chitinophagales bacterium]|nr:BamA/TamA family outer membrane protein [Chitinophagales bacterium]